jgi:chorismate-pyruvate lyase
VTDTHSSAPRWHTAADHQHFPGGRFADLLTFEGSLTLQLTLLSNGRFGLELMALRSLGVDDSEALLPHERRDWLPALCREVLMFANDEPVVFARTLVPEATARRQGWLADLGGASLGHALFVRDDVERSTFEFARCGADTAIQRRMRALAPALGTGEPVWARRSRFAIGGAELLVMEVFLPSAARLASDAGGSREAAR